MLRSGKTRRNRQNHRWTFQLKGKATSRCGHQGRRVANKKISTSLQTLVKFTEIHTNRFNMELPDKNKAARQLIRQEYLAENDWPWVIGFSGGKDSTLLLHLVVDTLKDIAPDERQRKIIVANNDTLVESPIFQSYVDNQLEVLKRNLSILGLPIQVIQTNPDYGKTFWCGLLGKGYPAPNYAFRWCTNNMKIKPTVALLKEMVKEHGNAVMLLGVRKAESESRCRRITKHETLATKQHPNFTPHTDVKGCHVFTPIKDWETWEVFETLVEQKPAWGGRHKEMLNLYMDAGGQDAECPFVVSEADAAGCGTNNARFGCWTCTVVKKNNSADNMAKKDDKDDKLALLGAFRERLREVSDEPDYRCFIRRNGQPGLGPLTIDARKMLLQELLELQETVDMKLISKEEIRFIEHIWRTDETTNLKRKVLG